MPSSAKSWHVKLRAQVGRFDLDVDLCGAGGPLCVIGPNGAGKTTLLRAIAGAQGPATGLIRLGERVVFASENGINVPPERRGIGYVPQGYALFPHLCVLDNVGFGCRAKRPERRIAAAQLLEQMEAGDLGPRAVGSLSGGERQRVALARALMVAPRMLLLDEPLTALDPAARRRVRGYLVEHLRSRGLPTLIVTHDVRDVRAFEGPICVLEHGRVTQHGCAQDLTANPATEFVAEFFDS